MILAQSITAGDAPPATASLYYLRTFYEVAKQRSFTRAGEELHLSQPAVSAHVRALERHFGARLFVVRHRRVYLTAEAEALVEYAERVLRLLGEAEHAVAAVRGVERGRLALGASTTIGVYLLPSLVGQFARAHPGVELQIAIDTTAGVVADVLAGRLPLGLVEAPVAHPDLEVTPFGTDELVLVVPAGHRWARRRAVPVGELDGVPVLRRETGSGTQAFVDVALERAGASMPTALVLGNTEALKQAVLAGIGIAWLPLITVAREAAAGQLAAVTVDALDLRRALWRITPRGQPLSPAMAAFLQLLASAAGSGPA